MLAELKHCTGQGSHFEARIQKDTAMMSRSAVCKNSVQRIKFTLLSYTLHKDSHFGMLNKQYLKINHCWSQEVMYQTATLLEIYLYLGNVEKNIQEKEVFRLKPFALSSWYAYPDLCLLYNSTWIKKNENPSIAKILRAVRSEEEQRGHRLIC